ncbi:MAG: Nif3-like dinuclear metal center hexameric protein [Bacillota bacterium]
MWATISTIADYLEDLAPAALAMPGDLVGLQIGNPRDEVEKILVALELDEAVLLQAEAESVGLVVTHHPLLFQPLHVIDESRAHGALIARIIRNKIGVYSAHTNLDIAPRGLNYHLAGLLGLAGAGREVLRVTDYDQLIKLVVFIPEGHVDDVRNALAEAGAGWIGKYSHCTFQAPGTGTFMPREGAEPYIGRPGSLEKVAEQRLETVFPASCRKRVIEALLTAHPYEEVAYDLYTLNDMGEPVGMGFLGRLEPPLSLQAIVSRCRERLNLSGIRYWAPDRPTFTKVAVCGGSGGSLVEAAARLGAELFISGDFRYHDLQAARAAGMGLIDAGHYGTEQPVIALLTDYITERLGRDALRTAVIPAGAAPTDWSYY